MEFPLDNSAKAVMGLTVFITFKNKPMAIAVKTILVYRSTFMVFSFGLSVELLLGIFFFRFEISS